jgi:hypothetical protein
MRQFFHLNFVTETDQELVNRVVDIRRSVRGSIPFTASNCTP